jgi:ribosomal protein S18 acetylase RimI-like enzyme
MALIIRPAGLLDDLAVADLVVRTPGGLEDLLGDPAAARRVAAAAFRSTGTAFSWTRTVVVDDDGAVAGEMVRFEGSAWKRLRVPTGLVMVVAAGVRHGRALVRGGRVDDRLMPAVPPDALYVLSLCVAPERRGLGVGKALLELAADEARTAGMRAVALDVASHNEGAIRLYRREGFAVVEERSVTTRRGGVTGSLRMELGVWD